MGVWKRAELYLMRKKGRSVLLLLILSVMGIFLLAGTAIRRGADKAAEDVRQSMTSGLKLERIMVTGDELYTSTWDEDGLEVVDAKADLFTETHLERILQMEGVRGYYIQFSGWNVYTGLKLQPGYCSSGLNGEHWMEEYGMPENETEEENLQWEIEFAKLRSQVMEFHTVYEGKWEPSFLNGSLSITEGRNIERTDEGKAVISDVVAEKNNLEVGDTITCQNFESNERYGSELELEIVGIFHINFKQSYTELTFEDEMIENMAFTDQAMNQWSDEEYHQYHNGGITGYRVGKAAEEVDSVRIYVEDPEYLPSVKEQILSMEDVDWQYYELELDDSDYRTVAKPLLFIKNLFTVFLIVLLVGMLIILSLVLSMWVKSRNHEIGVLTSIGIRKRTILFQILLECCMLGVAAFLLAGAVYRPVTHAAADVTAEIFSPKEGGEDYKMVYDMPTATFEIHREVSEPIDFEYGITGKTVFLLFFILLFVVIVSAFYSSIGIVSQKPKDILLRR